MAVTDERYASEIITTESEVFKFDDIGCLDKFRNGKPGLQVAGIYYKDFDSKNWLPEKEAHIVRTSAKTPMASGKVAFADSSRAAQFAGEHPPSEGMNLSSEGSDCTCCDSKGE
jgi:copper chaperone NosL